MKLSFISYRCNSQQQKNIPLSRWTFIYAVLPIPPEFYVNFCSTFKSILPILEQLCSNVELNVCNGCNLEVMSEMEKSSDTSQKFLNFQNFSKIILPLYKIFLRSISFVTSKLQKVFLSDFSHKNSAEW